MKSNWKRQVHKVAEENEGFAMLEGGLRNGEIRARGFKKKWQGDFSFSHNASWFSHNVQNGVGVRNWFANPLGFSQRVKRRWVCENFHMLYDHFV